MAFTPTEFDLDTLPQNVANLPLKHWHNGVFDYELIAQHLVSRDTAFEHLYHELMSKLSSANASHHGLSAGTYAGTQLALTETFDRIVQGYGMWFNVLGIESVSPRPLSLEEKKVRYKYQASSKDRYPPHLDTIPRKDQVPEWEIFDRMGLVQASFLLPEIVPKTFISRLAANNTHKFSEFNLAKPESGFSIAEIEQQNKENRKSGTDLMRGANIGDLNDWYTDACFAQQYLSGTKPTTLQRITDKLLLEFREATEDQQLKEVSNILNELDKTLLYVADCSHFREALGLKITDPIVLNPQDKGSPIRYACASVTLFKLHDNGNLHPLAIVIDYRTSIKDSLVIFNQRLSPSDPTLGESWPWRYAKTSAQSSDWTLHEMTVHLTNTRLIQEAIIVATHRCIPFDNVIYQLFEPHWFRMLSRNAALRETLVPQIVLDLVAYTQDQAFNFIKHAYHDFDFQGKYVPRDLHNRGFRPEDLDNPRFRNCAYARNINLMWRTIRKFVSSMIALQYKSDAQVAGDQRIKEWCREIKADDGGQIRTFPTITTFKQLVDAVTMCIHIASPQHSAVNYLRSFYQAFVINKPPCLFQPLPTTLEELQAVDEQFLVKSLPIGHQRYWLLAAHIPWLLSFRPAEDNNLINYAASLWNLYKKKGNKEKGPQITEIAKTFYEDLSGLIVAFEAQSKKMGEKERMIPYRVLDPRGPAISMLV